VIVDERLCERSAELGPYFLELLRGIDSPVVKTVRGIGLWLAVELHEPARRYCEALQQEGILCKETHANIIRLAPPLVIEREEIEWAAERIKNVVERLGAER